MANPRLPAMKAAVTGAAVKNPQRHKNRKAPKGTRSLGEPFARMTLEQREAWESFRAELPWLNSSHRAIVQVACLYRARIDAGEDVGVSALQAYGSILSKLAATPVDETKVSVPDDGEEEEDEFFGAH